MKAISLKQPWAWLVVNGFKPIEFRYRSSSFRGECFIHASKKFDDWGYEWLLNHAELPGVKEIKRMAWTPKIDSDFGVLIGKVTVIDCLPVEQARLFYPDEIWLTVCQRALGDKAFILSNPIAFPTWQYRKCKGMIAPLFFEVQALLPEKPGGRGNG